MKKMISLAVAAAMALSLAACGSKPAASAAPAASEAPSEAVSEAASSEQTAVGMANPWSETDAQGIQDKTGLSLLPPADAEVTGYFVMDTGTEKMAELRFTRDGIDYTLRAQSTGELTAYDMSGMYGEFPEEESVPMGYCDGVFKSGETGSILYWMDKVPGINYTLSSSTNLPVEVMGATAESCFEQVSAQPFDRNWSGQMDYTGVWTNDNGDSVTFTKTADGYDVVIGIVRLAEFTGKGHDMDGAVEMDLIDPNDGSMTAIFFPNEDTRVGGFTLRITGSTWSLAPEGTDFERFFLDAAATENAGK